MAETLLDTEAIICSLGNTANNPEMIVSRGTEVILNTMQASTLAATPHRRFFNEVGDSKNQIPFVFKMLTKTILRSAMQDKEAQEKLVQASNLDWIIVLALGGLTDNPATGNYRTGLDKNIMAGQVSRADVAAFVLQQLNDNTYLHQTPVIT